MPIRIERKVDLPAPLPPHRAWTVPASSSKRASRRAVTPPNDFLSPSTLSSVATFTPARGSSRPLIDICLPATDKRQELFVARRWTKVKLSGSRALSPALLCDLRRGHRTAISRKFNRLPITRALWRPVSARRAVSYPSGGRRDNAAAPPGKGRGCLFRVVGNRSSANRQLPLWVDERTRYAGGAWTDSAATIPAFRLPF